MDAAARGARNQEWLFGVKTGVHWLSAAGGIGGLW